MNPTPLAVISSMATKALLTELLAEFQPLPRVRSVALESVGGVDAARRRAGCRCRQELEGADAVAADLGEQADDVVAVGADARGDLPTNADAIG